MATVRRLLDIGARTLPRRDGIPDPRRETLWLLAHAWPVEETWLLLHPDADVPDDVADRVRDWLTRRALGEPAHHLVGVCPFWGRDFLVSSAVLVPRPESELLIQAALALPLPEDASVLDIGTGSGCLAVTLAAERPDWRVVAIDRSLCALVVARANARRHVPGVQLAVGDLARPLVGGWDLVVANLPYIPSGRRRALPVEVRHDPWLALDGGADGLTLVRRLVADLSRLLVAGGWALLELGEEQADAVAEAARTARLEEVRRIRDLAAVDRVVLLRRVQ